MLGSLVVALRFSIREGGGVVAVWDVLAEEHRLPWLFTPLERVGPLVFGMTHEQVQDAARGLLRVAVSQGASNGGWAEFWLEHRLAMGLSGPAISAYYDSSAGLAAVAVNALRGPQVKLDGIRLVGQTPSLLEDRFADYLVARGLALRYSQWADPCSAQLGTVIRAQRAGDVVLSRPVMVAAGWTDRCWDTTEGRIPQREWKTFEW